MPSAASNVDFPVAMAHQSWHEMPVRWIGKLRDIARARHLFGTGPGGTLNIGYAPHRPKWDR